MKDIKIAIIDMEWTTWVGSHKRKWSLKWEKKEIVQIGIVQSKNLEKIDKTLNLLFKIKKNKLSYYFQILTGIGQSKYNSYAKSFIENFKILKSILENTDVILCNGHDKEILIENLKLNNIKVPMSINKIKNIRPILSKILKIKQEKIISSELPNLLGLNNQRKKHDGLYDSIAIFESLRYLYRNQKISKFNLLY